MAKAASTASDGGKKKKKKESAAKGKKAAGAKPRKASAKSAGKLDGLSKLVDHPLVADLLAAGAIAAVAAIAEHQLDKNKTRSSSKLVKSAGKAAAAAMGKKLMGDLGTITDAATAAAKKA